MALPKAFKMQINSGWIKSKGAQHILKILENLVERLNAHICIPSKAEKVLKKHILIME